MKRSTNNRTCCWLFLTLLGLTQAAHGDLINGYFTDPGTPPDAFAGWATKLADFGRPTDGGGYAVFTESGLAGSELEQTFVLPALATRLRFDVRLASQVGGASGNPLTDSFQAALYDTAFNPLFPSDPLNPLAFPAFYSIEESPGGLTESRDPTFVTISQLADGWRRVQLDISSLSPQELTLEFILNGFGNDRETTAWLDNVVIETSSTALVPEPATALSAFVGIVVAAILRRQLLRPRPRA